METEEQPDREAIEALLEEQELDEELKEDDLSLIGGTEEEVIEENPTPIILDGNSEQDTSEMIKLKTPLVEIELGSNRYDINYISAILIETIKQLPDKCFHNGKQIKRTYV